MTTIKKCVPGAGTPCGTQSINQLQNNTFITSSQITKECRQESYMQRPVRRYEEVLNKLKEHGPMTARELARSLEYMDLNAVKPRLTELKSKGAVAATGKKFDPLTEKNVSVWRAL